MALQKNEMALGHVKHESSIKTIFYIAWKRLVNNASSYLNVSEYLKKLLCQR